jgi:hypothetical protein
VKVASNHDGKVLKERNCAILFVVLSSWLNWNGIGLRNQEILR